MPAEKALALVLKTTDWSETSRIATLWTREFGKVRALAKGGRRLKSSFESALDLLTVCSIVFLRKSSGSLDLLTEAQVVRRYPRLRTDLAALYAAYYVAESLTDWTEDYDPHPVLFDEALDALDAIGSASGAGPAIPVGLRVMRFEMVLLRELGYSPALESCAACDRAVDEDGLTFSAAAGGVVCEACRPRQRERRALSAGAWQLLRALAAPSPYPLPPEGEGDKNDPSPPGGEGRVRGPGGDWNRTWDDAVRKEVRQVLGHYVTYLLGRRPRLLTFLGS